MMPTIFAGQASRAGRRNENSQIIPAGFVGQVRWSVVRRYISLMHFQRFWPSLVALASIFPVLSFAQSAKPTLTLDEYLNTTDISEAKISPDGSSAVIATDTPDWKNSVYRHDLWLWTAQAGLRPLTHSGGEEEAEWSPDGKWIAFLSDRAILGDDASADLENPSDPGKPKRIWVISAVGGEPLPIYSEKLDAHAFAWSTDGASIYFSVQEPVDHDEAQAREEEWQDVIRWREQNRGDVLLK